MKKHVRNETKNIVIEIKKTQQTLLNVCKI